MNSRFHLLSTAWNLILSTEVVANSTMDEDDLPQVLIRTGEDEVRVCTEHSLLEEIPLQERYEVLLYVSTSPSKPVSPQGLGASPEAGKEVASENKVNGVLGGEVDDHHSDDVTVHA